MFRNNESKIGFQTETIGLNDRQINSINKMSNQTNKSLDESNNDSNTEKPKKHGILSYLQTLRSSKPIICQINTREVNKKNEITDKKPIFIMTKTNCIIKPLNLDNKLVNNSLKSSDNLLVPVYRLSSDKKRELVKRVKDSNSSIRSQTQTTPQKMRLWIPKSSLSPICKLVQVNNPNPLAIKLENDEPESDLISDDEYFRYLGFISSKKLCSEQNDSLNRWPLRTIAKVETSLKRDSNGDIILSDICQKPMCFNQPSTETNGSSTLNETNFGVSRKKLAKQKWLDEVRDNTQRLVQQKQIEKFKDDNCRRREKELKESKKEALNLVASFDISSFMGKRLFRSLFEAITDLDKYLLTMKIEDHCLTESVKYLIDSCINNSNKNSNSSISRITRSSNGFDWNPRHYQHKYCFNRMQRLEKWKRMETGLDWRARLLKSHCKRLYIKMKKIIKCPFCTKAIDSLHQCCYYDSDFNHNYSYSPLSNCLQNDTNDEIVIIENDFSNYELRSQDCGESSGEDDDVIIIEEVIRPNSNVLKLKQTYVENQLVISSSDSNECMAFSKLRSLQTSNDLQNSINFDIESASDQSLVQENRFKNQEFVFCSQLYKK